MALIGWISTARATLPLPADAVEALKAARRQQAEEQQANALKAAAASFDRVVTTRDTETGSDC
jgi:hypothetical protein